MKLDEFTVGQTFTTKKVRVTKADILRFAREFDPQYMHIDEEKAKQGRFNGIIASGMHTISLTFKLWVEEGLYGDEVIAGTEMNQIRFTRPVYPGNTLQVTVEVTGKQERNKEVGILTVLLSTYNEKEEKVFEGDVSVLIKR